MHSIRERISRRLVRDQGTNCEVLSRYVRARLIGGSMSATGVNQKFLDGLKSKELLLKLTWDEWLDVKPPYPHVGFSIQDVTTRYHRNGYDWDMHGSLFTPEKEIDPRRAFVFFHGGAGSEKIMDLTPDGRPGLARAVAAQDSKF